MALRARQRSENRRAGGLKGRDRGWLPGSCQVNAIGIPSNLVNKVREKTHTLVSREAAPNNAGGILTEAIPHDFGDGHILIDTKSLVVKTNQLGGIGRYRSQFNVGADGIKYASYYLKKYPEGYFEETSGQCNTKCESARPNSSISLDSNNIIGIHTRHPNPLPPPNLPPLFSLIDTLKRIEQDNDLRVEHRWSYGEFNQHIAKFIITENNIGTINPDTGEYEAVNCDLTTQGPDGTHPDSTPIGIINIEILDDGRQVLSGRINTIHGVTPYVPVGGVGFTGPPLPIDFSGTWSSRTMSWTQSQSATGQSIANLPQTYSYVGSIVLPPL